MARTRQILRPTPTRIRFHGQSLEFTREVKYLVADETAVSVVGHGPRRQREDEEAWEGTLTAVLNLFDKTGGGYDPYEWLVTPNQYLHDGRPLERIEQGESEEVIKAARRLLEQ